MSRWQLAEAEIAEANAYEPFHFVSDVVKHPANLPVDALSQHETEPRRRELVNALNFRALPVEVDAAREFLRERGIPRLVDRDLVFLVDLVARVRELLREVAVVSQEQETFTLQIEAADVEEARKLRR